MHTYFISDGLCVKIGKSHNPLKRLQSLQTASATKLTLLLILNFDHEQELHQQFSRDRLHGEWFTLTPELNEYINSRSAFFRWLSLQVDRDDPIGDLAKDAVEDKKFPQSSEYSVLRMYLVFHPTSCRRARSALAHAYREWQVIQRGRA